MGGARLYVAIKPGPLKIILYSLNRILHEAVVTFSSEITFLHVLCRENVRLERWRGRDSQSWSNCSLTS
jgi:hypothetical protein